MDGHQHRPIEAVPRPLKRDGEVARNLLNTYVDEVLAREQKINYTAVEVPDDGFDAQLKALEDQEVPLISQTARKKAIWPVHGTEQRKRCIDICKRVKRNEGTMISCRLSSELMDDELVIRLCSALRENSCLQKLMLHDNAITDKAILPLCRALRLHPSVNAIWLGANQLSDTAAEHLSNLLSKNNVVKDINLSNKWPIPRWLDTEKLDHPHISHIGAAHFASALANCCGLTSLSLHDQRVRDVGAAALFAAIPSSNLVLLNLGKNEITDEACTELSTCLSAHYCPLRELFLDHNQIGNKGAVIISRGLTNNSSLFTLDLNSNRVGEQGIEALYEILCVNETIEALMIRNNEYSGDVIESHLAERKLERDAARNDANEWGTPGSRRRKSRSSTPKKPLSKWRKARDPKELAKILQNNTRFNQIRSDFSGRLLSPSSWSRYREENQHGIQNLVLTAMDNAGISSSLLRGSPEGVSFTPMKTGSDNFSNTIKSTTSTNKGDCLPCIASPYVDSRPGTKSLMSPLTGSRHSQRDSSPSSVDSRESTRKYQEDVLSRGRSGENLTGANANPSRQSRMDRILSKNKADVSRTKDEIGKTLGVPNLKGLVGRAPIRSSISRHSDSGTNLIHLRVNTPADPPDSSAISLIKIDIDRQKERERVRTAHQTEEYKEEKYLTMFYGNRSKLLANAKPTPPDKFWKEWKAKVQVMHPNGIDTTAQERQAKLKKLKEQEERVQHEFDEAFHREKEKKSPSKNNNFSKDADSPGGSGCGTSSPYKKLKEERHNTQRKKDYYSDKDASKAQKSMLELLAIEYVHRSNKNVDVEYLRRRAIDPVREHIGPLLRNKGSPNSPQNSSFSPQKSQAPSQYSSISYPAMVGLSENHNGVGAQLLDKRKLSSL